MPSFQLFQLNSDGVRLWGVLYRHDPHDRPNPFAAIIVKKHFIRFSNSLRGLRVVRPDARSALKQSLPQSFSTSRSVAGRGAEPLTQSS